MSDVADVCGCGKYSKDSFSSSTRECVAGMMEMAKNDRRRAAESYLGSVMFVCNREFEVISSLPPSPHVTVNSPPRCPAPPVTATLAVANEKKKKKKKIKETWKRKQIMQFLHSEMCTYVQLMCFILILYC